jgi:UDP-N-acetylmuramoylalanine--D-glutamate ligase
MPLTPPDFLRPLLASPVAIFGGGVSGEGVRALLGALGATGAVYDEKGAAFTPAAAAAHALVIFSPGFARDHAWLARARAAGAECLGELDFASLCWRGRVLAITGTNGKTTLTEFLAHALRTAGREAHATGNIGHPFSRLAAETDGGTAEVFAVCEVSSFQAETLRYFRAGSTLWTNFSEDHLDRHAELRAYFAAKWNLVAHTTGAVFAGSSVQRAAQAFAHELPAAAVVATEHRPADKRLEGLVFDEYPQRENFLLAEAWWRAEGLPPEPFLAAARTFRLGRHRLARVAEHAGVTYWNDSKATNFHAVEAALARFDTPVVLIAGGRAKGGDIAGFVRRIARRVDHMILLGETSDELARQCRACGIMHTSCPSLEQAVRCASELAGPGRHVLLSPGFASFDLFHGYADRGEQFERCVRDLHATGSFG